MSDSTPKPSIPTPNIPKPSIPAPNLKPTNDSPPISAVESGAMEPTLSQPAPEPEPVATFDEEEASAIEYSESLLPQRLLAGLIDGVVAAGLFTVASLILPEALAMVSLGFAFGYLLFKDSLPFLQGQSIGKKVMKLQAVTADGQPLTSEPIRGIKRNILSSIPFLALLEIYILHSREKASNAGLRLGDDFAQTKVISISSKTP